MKTKKVKKMPRYKRHIRYACWQISKYRRVRNKVEKCNQWATDNRKTFFTLVVGTLVFASVATFISILYDLTKAGTVSEQEDFSGRTENIENIQPMMNGLRQIEETKKSEKLELKQLTDKGVAIHKELDSLLAIREKSHEDFVRIVQDYRQLQHIVNFLKKRKE
jgi:hypothetical protein